MFHRFIRGTTVLVIAAMALIGSSPRASAQTYTWNLDAAGTWDTTTTNWLLAGAPAAWTNGPNTAVFGGVITANRAIAVAAGGITAGQLSFTNAGTFAYTIGTAGNNLTLNNGASDASISVARGFNGAATYSGAGGNTITGSNITFFNNLAIANNGGFGTTALTIAGNIDRNAAGGNIAVSGQGNTLLSGVIGNTVTGGIIKSGTGTLILTGATNSFTGGLTINAGVAGIGSNDAMLGDAANNVTVNGGGTFRFNSTVTSARGFNINGTAAAPSGIDLGSSVVATLSGTSATTGLVGGASSVANVTLTGGTTAGILSIEGAQTGFLGTLNVGRGGIQLVGSVATQRPLTAGSLTTLRLQNNGTLPNAAALNFGNAAALNIVQPATAITGRLGTVPLTMHSGRFQYTTNASNNTAFTDNLGPLTISGLVGIAGSANTVNGVASGVNFASLTRQDNATVFFRGPGTGTSSIGGTPGTGMNYTVTGMSALAGVGTANARIIPWAANPVGVAGTDPQNLITYDANGFRQLTAAEITVVTTTLVADANNNVQGTVNNPGTITVNSIFNSTATPQFTGTGTVTVTDGAISNFNTMTFNGPSFVFPNGGYLHLGFPMNIQGTSSFSGSNGLAVSALGTSTSYRATFTNTVANPFTGGLFINGNAQVAFNNDNQLGATGAGNGITLGGGQLLYAGAANGSLDATRTIRVGESNGTIGATTAGVVLTVPGLISGPGQLQIGGGTTAVATSVVSLTNAAANTYTGGTVISNGVARLLNANQLGTGAVLLNGGTLQAAANLTFASPLTSIISSTLDTQANNITLNGGLNGSGGTLGTSTLTSIITKTGTGILTIAGDSNFAGTITLGANAGTLTINGNGSLPELTALNIGAGSNLLIDNATTYNANRIGDRTSITLSGGFGGYLAPGTATTDPAERMGNLTSTASGSVFTVSGSGAATNGTIIRFSGLTATQAITIRGDNLGAATLAPNVTRILIDSITSNQAVLTNVFFAGTSGSSVSSTQAGYDIVRGIIQFTPTPISGTLIDNFPATNTPLTAAFTTSGDTTANTGASIFSLVLDAGSTLTLNNGGNAPSGVNANTPTGTLAISGGLLTSQNGNKTVALGSANPAVITFGAAAATITTTSDLTIAANIALNGTSSLTKAGAGTLTVGGTYGIAGPLAINAGTVSLAASSTVGDLSGTGTLNVPGAVTVNQIGTSTFSGSMTNVTGFTKSGAGTLILSLANTPTFSGGTTIANGQLTLGNANTATSVLGGAVAFGSAANTSGTLDLNGFSPGAAVTGLVINGTGTGHRLINSNTVTASTVSVNLPGDATVPIAVGGNLIFNKNDANLLVLTGTTQPPTTTTGIINVNAGTFRIASGVPVSPGMNFSVATGATLDFGAFGNNDSDALAFGTITSNGGTVQVASGLGDLATNRVIINNGATWTFSGTTNFWWHFRNAGAGITVNASSTTATISGPTTGSRIQNDTGSALPITVNAGTTTSGIDVNANVLFSGAGANSIFNKIGAGTMQLSFPGNNTASFQVGAGTLQVATGTSISGTTTVNGGVVRGIGTLSGAVTVNNGGFIRGGSTDSQTGTLTVTANTVINTNGGIEAAVNRSAANTASSGLINLTGAATTLNLGAGGTPFVIRLVNDPAAPMVQNETYTITLATVATAGNIQLNGVTQPASTIFSGSSYTLVSPSFTTFNNPTLSIDALGTSLVLQFTPVPEPATLLGLAAVTVAGAGWVRRRRQKTTA